MNSGSNYMQCMDNDYWQVNTSRILSFLDFLCFYCPDIPFKVDLEKSLNLKQTCENGIVMSCWVDHNSVEETSHKH